MHITGVQEKKNGFPFCQFISNLIIRGSDLFVPWFGLGGARIREAFMLWDSFGALSLDSLLVVTRSTVKSSSCMEQLLANS